MSNELVSRILVERIGLDAAELARRAERVCSKAKSILESIGAVHHVESVEERHRTGFVEACVALALAAWLLRRNYDRELVKELISVIVGDSADDLVELSRCVYGRIPSEEYSILCVLARISLMLAEPGSIP